jgi:hypothetical protein
MQRPLGLMSVRVQMSEKGEKGKKGNLKRLSRPRGRGRRDEIQACYE